ncbi:hypothetical protein [Marinomonas balearica]|uniref:STAS domain-containing protein n=1 Tax=Marinomonas balearica TaxID=491947 RepID=A0A4R6ME46_9GAMM|nr:hypothetical protein [Marinomonas balearica]TDO99893.1 hypothetical protein DFP79_0902 [Marinomonas balearica]
MKMTVESDKIVFSGVYSLESIKEYSEQINSGNHAPSTIDVSALIGAGAPLFALFLQVVKKSRVLSVVGASVELIDMAKLYGVDQVLTFEA